jgi:hypothetical protein
MLPFGSRSETCGVSAASGLGAATGRVEAQNGPVCWTRRGPARAKPALVNKGRAMRGRHRRSLAVLADD